MIPCPTIAFFVIAAFPIPDCHCEPPIAKTLEEARELLAGHDLVFVGEVIDRKYQDIEPEYFGQNVHKNFVRFKIATVIKGNDAPEVTIRIPLNAGCERFYKSSKYLVFATSIGEIYETTHCSGTKPWSEGVKDEVRLLLDATSSNKSLHWPLGRICHEPCNWSSMFASASPAPDTDASELNR